MQTVIIVPADRFLQNFILLVCSILILIIDKNSRRQRENHRETSQKMCSFFERAAKGRVAHAAMLCGSLSPYSVLARGYSIARKAGSVLKSSADASEGDRVEVQLAAGRLGCRVETIITEEEL